MSTLTVSPAMQTPPPGAVCPAMVMYGLRMFTSVSRLIVPATRNTTVRGPLPWQAARKLPGPLSARVVTS
ncbi:MAG: hypothetical protein MUP47_09140 [Phycisphaerae bacterium]|nr:hypothetical protein [Phycisphaerae bacterium]